MIAQACDRGVTRAAYVDYLSQAYHHVRHTCPLLALAASRCDDGQAGYREALFDYIAEERGHEAWILQDIADLGGDAAAVKALNVEIHHCVDHIITNSIYFLDPDRNLIEGYINCPRERFRDMEHPYGSLEALDAALEGKCEPSWMAAFAAEK